MNRDEEHRSVSGWKWLLFVLLMLFAAWLLYAVVAKDLSAKIEKRNVAKKQEEILHVQQAQQQAQQHKARLVEAVSDIKYVKDPRTNDICYAITGNINFKNSFIAAVPCEKVPPKLLTVVKP